MKKWQFWEVTDIALWSRSAVHGPWYVTCLSVALTRTTRFMERTLERMRKEKDKGCEYSPAWWSRGPKMAPNIVAIRRGRASRHRVMVGKVVSTHTRIRPTQLSPGSGDFQTMPNTVFRVSSIVPYYDPDRETFRDKSDENRRQ
jgi:hypothetical protein